MRSRREYGPEASTYGQGYMEFKDFYSNILLKIGDRCEETVRTTNEELTPLAKHFIIEKWLLSIDPRLPAHILRTRGSLFTADRPHLSCNQEIMCDQIPTILAELEAGESTNNISIGQLGSGYRPSYRPYFRPSTPTPAWRGGRVFSPRTPYPAARAPSSRAASAAPCPQDTCFRCYGAGRRGPESKTHQARSCLYARTQMPVRTVLLMPPAQTPQPTPALQQVQLPYEEYEQAYNYDYMMDQHNYETGDYGRFEEYEEPVADYLVPGSDSKDSNLYSLSIDDLPPPPTVNAIPTEQIQKFTFLHKGKQSQLCIDSGAEIDVITKAEADRLGVPILPLSPNDKIPTQADGKSTLQLAGKAVTDFEREGLKLRFHGYIVNTLSKPVLCGKPFMKRNDLVQFVNKRLMVAKGRVVLEDPTVCPSPILPFDVRAVEATQENTRKNLDQIEIGKEVTKKVREKLQAIHQHYADVFDGNIKKPYNGMSGCYDVDFDFINDVPPPIHPGSIPTYAKQGELHLLQSKIDQLEENNIVAKASDLGIVVKYASPCLLVRKKSAKMMSKQ